MRASSSPTPTGRISSTRSESVPRPKKYDGLPWTTTRAPSASGGTVPRTMVVGAVRLIETSAAGSRSTRNAVPDPGRAATWVSWPSTHTAPSRSIHAPILRATVRTGHGSSALVAGGVVTPGVRTGR